MECVLQESLFFSMVSPNRLNVPISIIFKKYNKYIIHSYSFDFLLHELLAGMYKRMALQSSICFVTPLLSFDRHAAILKVDGIRSHSLGPLSVYRQEFTTILVLSPVF